MSISTYDSCSGTVIRSVFTSMLMSMQCILLKMCLDYRPNQSLSHPNRPFHIWAWQSPRRFWEVQLLLIAPLTQVPLRACPLPYRTSTPHRPFPNLRNNSWLRRPRDRSHPPHPPIPGQLPSQICSRVPHIRNCRLARRRCLQMFLLFLWECQCYVAV